MSAYPDHIVFFDGVCGLCNKSIDLLVRIDKHQVLRYAPLQGSTASVLLSASDVSGLQSLVYYSSGLRYDRSDAILHIVADMGGLWKSVLVFKIVPRFFRNALYRWIANNRYNWFGKKESCRIPTAAERPLFLD